MRARSLAALSLILFFCAGWLGDPRQLGQIGAQRYAVASDTELASRAGAEVLAAGGNAADAAAATMLALGVASPASSGLGGGGFALYYRASDRTLTFLDFRERAPAAATADMFHGQVDGDGVNSRPSQMGGLATAVPGEPAGIDELLRRFGGGVSRDAVAAPAIRLAEQGFAPTAYVRDYSARFVKHMQRDAVLRTFFARDGSVRDELRNPTLGRTLRAFAHDGAAPFYTGAIAREIVRANRRAGGIMTADDLAAYRVVERAPLSREIFGHRWVTAPPPSAGGYTLLASLAFLERVLGPRPRARGAAVLHAFAEAFKGPFLDRAQVFGDPDHVEVPIDRMLTDARIDRRASSFHPTLATPTSAYAVPLETPPRVHQIPNGGGTSHLCVVDAEGNVAAVTTTVNLYFGARYTAAGIVMNDEMDDFASDVGVANEFGLPGGEQNLPGPGRRPVSTMTPTIVFQGDSPVLCVGGAGGSKIVTASAQVAYRTLVEGMPIFEALTAPRIHHQGLPDELVVETTVPLPDEVLADLRARGHTIAEAPYNANVQAIHIGEGSLRLVAASDPRKGGRPAGE